MSTIRVLVVDDSVVVRRLVTDALAADPEIEVVGTAANGEIALERLDALRPDLVTLDIEMPVLDGIGTLRGIRAKRPRLPVVMFSTLTEAGASATLDALAAGANDFVTKPANDGSVGKAIEAIQQELIPKIKTLTGRRVVPPPTPPAGSPPGPSVSSTPPAARPVRPATGSTPGISRPAVVPASPALPQGVRPAPAFARRIAAVVVGVSTGGPNALAAIWPGLARLPVPLLIVQHMPPVFTGILAKRLDDLGTIPVAEASDGDELVPGRAWLAPGGFHMTIARVGATVRVHLDESEPLHGCRPAADRLFDSAAAVYGASTLGLVLTGMGNDGAEGARTIRLAGGTVLAQDEPSSVVWGMPGAVVGAGLADEVVPLSQVAATVNRCVGTSRPGADRATGAPAATTAVRRP